MARKIRNRQNRVIGLTVEVVGATQALEALAAVNVHADRAQRSAMRAAARKARSTTAKAFAALAGVPQKLYRKRVTTYARRTREGRAAAQVWAGFKHPIKFREHAAVEKVLRARHPGAFVQEMDSGHVGLFVRTSPSRRVGAGARQRPKARGALPIEEAAIDITDEAPPIMEREARSALNVVYPRVLKTDFLRRVKKARARRSRR